MKELILLYGHKTRDQVAEANCETEDTQAAKIFIRSARLTACWLRCSMVHAVQTVEAHKNGVHKHGEGQLTGATEQDGDCCSL